MNSFLELLRLEFSYNPLQDQKLNILLSVISSVLAFLCLYLIWALLIFLKRTLWMPLSVQRQLRSQGVRGLPYSFLYGNTKEMMSMIQSSMITTSVDISHHIFPRIQPHIYAWSKLYGSNFFYWFGPQAQLVVTEPALIKEILSNKEGVYGQKPVEGFVKKLLGDGLLSAEGEKWYKLRKLANHSFHSENLKGMIPAMIFSTEIMLDGWKEKESQEIEVLHEFKKLTSDVISRTAFGSSYQNGQHIFDLLTKMTSIVQRNAFKIRLPGIEKFLKSEDDIESDLLDEGMKNLVAGMIKEREEANDYGTDFFGSLVKAFHHEDQDSRISLHDMVSQCKTFYLAGHETTSSLLTWTVLLLSIHPDWQERARDEVLDIFGTRNPTAEGIGKLKTLLMIINESLRLYAPVLVFQRQTKRAVKLQNITIPAEVDIIIPPLALHTSPEIWGADVHLFKPERFAEGVANATGNNPVAFFPFSWGPRTCVGMSFAATEVKVALSMILRRYKLKLSPSYVHCPASLLTSYPARGVQIMLQKL
ncbi:unnamed protein product [Rhodiola kirilowii]